MILFGNSLILCITLFDKSLNSPTFVTLKSLSIISIINAVIVVVHTYFLCEIIGTLWDFKNCVTDNLFWAKLLYSGVFVKEIIQKLFLNHFIGKLSNSSILGVKFQFCQILSFQTNFLALMYQA
jgi:hypothetical protein